MGLTSEKCVPCKGGTPPMPMSEVRRYLREVPGWSLDKTLDKGLDMIYKDVKFKDFKEALAFVNKVGRIAESEGHHPDIKIYSWNRVMLVLYTHAIGGLSRNDFIVAAKISQKMAESLKRG